MIFSEGIYYDKENDQTRTTKLKGILTVMAGLKWNWGKKETGTSELIFKNSGFVPRTGVEPALPFREKGF